MAITAIATIISKMREASPNPIPITSKHGINVFNTVVSERDKKNVQYVVLFYTQNTADGSGPEAERVLHDRTQQTQKIKIKALNQAQQTSNSKH